MEALQRGQMAASLFLDFIRHHAGISQRERWVDA
jgi:hypothetical protein